MEKLERIVSELNDLEVSVRGATLGHGGGCVNKVDVESYINLAEEYIERHVSGLKDRLALYANATLLALGGFIGGVVASILSGNDTYAGAAIVIGLGINMYVSRCAARYRGAISYLDSVKGALTDLRKKLLEPTIKTPIYTTIGVRIENKRANTAEIRVIS